MFLNSLFSFSYFINFLYFAVVIIFAFYIPGAVIIQKLKLDRFLFITYSLIFGIVMWAFQGFIFGFLQLRELTYVYVLVFLILWIWQQKKNSFKFNYEISISRKDLSIIAVLVIGVLIQLYFNAFNGISIQNGLFFCCGLPDIFYHYGLVNSLIYSFPPYEPAMHNVLVKNYHYLGNLATADLIRVFKLPFLLSQTNYFVFLISTLIGFSVISLGRVLKLGRVFIVFLLVFTFFLGDITYLLTLFSGQGINFSFPFLYNSTQLWYSPPRAFALAITYMAIGLLYLWIKKGNTNLTLILSITFASLIGFKIYNGISLFVGLLFLSSYYALKKEFSKIYLFIISFIIGLLIYLPVNSGASGLSFVGFWRFENFISQPGFGLGHWELARQIFLDNNNYIRVVQHELMYVLFYFVFVFGVLNLAFIQTKSSMRMLPKELHIFLLSAISVSLILGFFFFQKISGANTSQFLISAEILISIYLALICMYIYKKFPKFKYIFLALIILITVPRVIDSTYAKYKQNNNGGEFFISNNELKGLDYLKNNTSEDVIILSDNRNLKIEKYCYYINFITNRSLYICDSEGILTDHGVDTEQRFENYNNIINYPSNPDSIELLEKERIDYLYLPINSTSSALLKNDRFESVYEGENIRIIKFK